MRFLKNKILWLTIYAISVTGIFLYLLFPSPLVLQQIEAAAGSAGYVLKAGALHPSLPSGIKLKDLTLRPVQPSADVLFQGELLDLQFNPVSIFLKHKTIHFKGTTYSGKFDGHAGFLSSGHTNAPAELKISFQNIDLSRYSSAGFPLLKGMTGHIKGNVFYTTKDAAVQNPAGTLSLYLSRGALPLPEPFLGVSRIEFDRGEIQAQLKNGVVTFSKLEVYGPQMNCFFSGNIHLMDRQADSRLNLKGVMEIAGKTKIKMNVTVGGTLASPLFRYI